MNLRRLLLMGSLIGAVSMGAVPLAHATFAQLASSTSTLATGTLQPATNLVVDRRCTSVLGLVVSAQLDTSWGASSSAAGWPVGYRVDLLNADGTVVMQTATVAPGQSRSKTFTLTELLLTATYRVRVVTTYGANWTSTPATAIDTSC